jgi:hypothetical protein
MNPRTSTIAVVLPSPTVRFVIRAASRARATPWLTKGSSIRISLAIARPSRATAG